MVATCCASTIAGNFSPLLSLSSKSQDSRKQICLFAKALRDFRIAMNADMLAPCNRSTLQFRDLEGHSFRPNRIPGTTEQYKATGDA